MNSAQKWRSLKVREAQYEALAACSEKTGRPIIKLADEALTWFIRQVVPVYINHAEQAQKTIARRLAAPRRRKPARKAEQIESVSIAS